MSQSEHVWRCNFLQILTHCSDFSFEFASTKASSISENGSTEQQSEAGDQNGWHSHEDEEVLDGYRDSHLQRPINQNHRPAAAYPDAVELSRQRKLIEEQRAEIDSLKTVNLTCAP